MSLVRDMAVQFDVHPLLIAAVILQESAGISCAQRFEPRWRYHWNTVEWARVVGSTVSTERVGQATSWGFMQVMGGVAREQGFNGWFPELCKPELGIYYGTKVLSQKLDEYPEGHDAIAAYNAGTPRKREDGTYRNQEYVDGVLTYLESLESM